MTPQELIVEAKIQEALERGEDRGLPGAGKPVRGLEEYFDTPEHLRMAFSTLKGADAVPEELEILKRANAFQEEARRAEERGDGKLAEKLRLKESEWRAVYAMKMQSFRRG